MRALTRSMAVVTLLGACATTPAAYDDATFQTMTSDGVVIAGERYFGGLGPDTPLILLFHQGGSNGRGEYAPLVEWLNAEGYRAIAWDSRAGGDTYGESNRTVSALAPGVPNGYCDAYPDLQAALDHAISEDFADEVIVWGSSYSATLVFQLAAKNSESVSAVLAFSPPSGGPLEPCLAREWVDTVEVPMLLLRPGSEMERPSVVLQRDILTAAGASFLLVPEGVHGSSMLVDARTAAPMEAYRVRVADWLADNE
ncbi:MAG: alpha/beta hydrolase [Pseudomonadota bacterium]